MKIGIYKVGRPICFGTNPDDHSAISIEVTRIIDMFAKKGHTVHILSESDYIPQSIENVSREAPETLDKAFVFNGKGDYTAAIKSLSQLTTKLCLIVTDLSLMPKGADLMSFSQVSTQSETYHTYGAIEQQECYGYNPANVGYPKSIDFYFGGTERGRSKEFIEYVVRPNVRWRGKSDTLDIVNYVPYYEHIELMKKTTYSIVIADEAYNTVGFVTPRYYECLRYDVIAFVSMQYDPNQTLIKVTDFRRVAGYADLLHKMKKIEQSRKLYCELIEQQRAEITQAMCRGDNIINNLLLSPK